MKKYACQLWVRGAARIFGSQLREDEWYTNATVMDASEQFAFPSPQPQDTSEVREAIEQAGILWSEDPKESLKWLRKAAEFASDAGDDLRSVQLAKVSADLRNLANISPSIPPPTTLPPRSIPLPSAPVVVGEAIEGEVQPQEPSSAVAVDTVAAVSALSEQPVDAAAVTATVAESAGPHHGSSEFGHAGEGMDQQATPNAPPVTDGAVDQAAAAAAVMALIPQVSFSKDPGQTVPATPAASAAALALATAPASYQSVPAPATSAPVAGGAAYNAPGAGGQGFGGGMSGQGPSSPLAAAPNAATSGPNPAFNGSLAGALAAKRASGGFVGSAGVALGGPRPEQPTLVGRPLQGAPNNGPRGVNDETPAATPAAIQADSVAPGSTTRFVQHRAVEVAISVAPNATGHFDLHPLAEGENVEPGFRRALLVALASEDRLFPGRG